MKAFWRLAFAAPTALIAVVAVVFAASDQWRERDAKRPPQITRIDSAPEVYAEPEYPEKTTIYVDSGAYPARPEQYPIEPCAPKVCIDDDFRLDGDPVSQEKARETWTLQREDLAVYPRWPAPSESFGPSPSYPRACRDKRIEGDVVVEFDIAPDGTVQNARIVDSPDRCFNASVLRTVERYRYQPPVDENGRPTTRRNVRRSFSFELTS